MYSLRRGQVNIGLIIILSLTVLAVVGYWGCRMRANSATPTLGPDDPKEIVMYCDECGEIMVPTLEARKLADKKEGDKVQCWNCKKFLASYTKPMKPGKKVIAP